MSWFLKWNKKEKAGVEKNNLKEPQEDSFEFLYLELFCDVFKNNFSYLFNPEEESFKSKATETMALGYPLKIL